MTQPVLVVLDDDPTGTQTVHDVPVLTEWSVESLKKEFLGGSACFYILTNSRALPPAEAANLNRELGQNLLLAAEEKQFVISSRSDSTLRGHFPLETDVLNEILGPYDATFLIPYFEAGGRVTIDDIHYVREGESLIPASETPFAKDPAFGYNSSNLKDYVEEKTHGRVRRNDVVSISSNISSEDLNEILTGLSGNTYVVVNAATRNELDKVCCSIRDASAKGKAFLFRTAAEFVASWIQQSPAPLLSSEDLHLDGSPGIIVAGSYVPKTTRQLESLISIHGITTVILDVPSLISDTQQQEEIDRAIETVNTILLDGKDVLLMTSREPIGHENAALSLASGKIISDALVKILKATRTRPGWILAKGGITSSDIASKALGIQRSIVAGQLLPGIPVWVTGPETSFPDMPYIIFPGNVGSDQSLSDAYEKLTD